MVNMILPGKANIEMDKFKEYDRLLILIPRPDKNKIHWVQ